MPLPLTEVAVLDGNAEALGVPLRELMANAGAAVADAVRERRSEGAVVFLVGPGNNGGDGLVAAAQLASEMPVRIVTPVEGDAFKTQLARDAYEALPGAVDVQTARTVREISRGLRGAGIVVDALLGAGIQGELREPYRAYVEAANHAGVPLVSVDVPTGFGKPLHAEPTVTVTFHDVKVGMDRGNSGEIVVADIGIPPEAVTHTGPGEMSLYPRARREQHKGQGGFVLVIGGGPYHGAPVLCGLAAMRSGADLSIVLTPERAADIVAASSPNLVVRPLRNEDLDFEDPKNRVTLNLWLKKAHAVVIGPGLGRFNVTKQSIHHAVARANAQGIPCVVDADAIWALADDPQLLGPGTVVTPHAREFQDLTGEKAPADVEARGRLAQRFAERTGTTVLFKGPVDVVASAERVKFNATGTPAMSHGGTGDVLAGIVAALLSKGLSPFDAARVGAYLSGRAGEVATAERSMGMLASDVVEAIPRVLRAELDGDGS